ncbi:hypothetical protein [Falsiroseomonas tokyonensis]|uniref:Sulfotransferase family protein n=1 Tax=Falsiroseomonas tokyonensis TaxID=430521 RepID=A0ABV7C5P0_9PROT|nr:hypothetical protein [Falsiroseomonas tokyonensis]MBU8541493.1 hypothetical protein [Falsiroseomonas tokyonensis]
MLAARKIFHLHISKCGGTAFNALLDTQAHAERARSPADFAQRLRDRGIAQSEIANLQDPALRDTLAEAARESIAWYDVLHGHIDIAPWLAAEDHVVTVLRRADRRALSQFQDYRRLAPHDYVHKPADWQRMHEACRGLADFAALRDACADNPAFRSMFEDHQCRALTQHSVPAEAFDAMAPEERAEQAWRSVQAYHARIGVLEEVDRLLGALSRDLGWCPPDPLEVRNPTRPEPHSEAALAAAAALTAGDRILHARAVAALREAPATDYTLAEFEAEFVAARLATLQPMRIGAEQVFDMNMPIVGRGLHGRDAAGSRECCRWVGASREALIYLPVPGPGARLTLRLYNKGWIDPALRDRLTVTVDGMPVRSWSEPRREVAEAICCRAVARRGWMRIGLHGEQALTDREAGRPSEDARRKIFNLWRISTQVD